MPVSPRIHASPGSTEHAKVTCTLEAPRVGNGWYKLVFAPADMAASITHFVSLEMGNFIDRF
jgi:hypothetical protein